MSEASSRTNRRPPRQDAVHRDHVRSPVDVVRAIAGALLVAGGIAGANALDSTLLGLSRDGASAIAGFPDWVRQVPQAVLAVGLMAGVGGTAAWAVVTTRFRRLVLLSLAFYAAAAATLVAGELIFGLVDEHVQRAFDGASSPFTFGLLDRPRPGDALLAGSVAMLAVSSSYLRRRLMIRIGLVIGVYAVVSVWSSGVPALGLVTDVGSGLLVASLVLLAAGRHDLAPNPAELQESLASVGIDVTGLERLSVDARGSAPWMGTSAERKRIFVKALGRDERSSDMLFRVYRWLRWRKTGDHRPFVSLQRAVEHEALVSLQAAAVGIRTPRILGVSDAGIDGMALAYEAIDGSSADELDDLGDESLAAIWRMVGELHARRIAHRDLRLANVFIDVDGSPWLIDFGFSELAASDQLLGVDVAELLASTATLVGAERAVAAAHAATGLAELERAMPWLQPNALSRATRQAIGEEKGLAPIRRLLVEVCGVPEEEPVKLERVSRKSLFTLATIGLSVWFLAPQLADVDSLVAQTRDASVPWATLAVVFSIVTYVAATGALLGAIPRRLSFGPALLAQSASSFANRVTLAKVGGVATNLRYFQKQGVPMGVSVTAVGLNALAGVVVHIGLTLLFLLLVSGADEASLPILSPSTVWLALGVIAGVAAISAAVPITRRVLRAHVIPQLRAGWVSMRTIGRSPARLAVLFGGSAAITLAYLGAMFASLEAFGSSVPLPLVALLYLTAGAVANAAPTPGGIGAVEAALIAAYSTVEDPAVVVPAVFLYRLVTFWLPILPGWAALVHLRRTDRL